MLLVGSATIGLFGRGPWCYLLDQPRLVCLEEVLGVTCWISHDWSVWKRSLVLLVGSAMIGLFGGGPWCYLLDDWSADC